ncbi:MAG: hypothetical protein JO092_06220 [Candidatus Eremiobacteraeota bacterium]|nr:hypothetical protein [Candidatus Eremiobacteraeota bacterium]
MRSGHRFSFFALAVAIAGCRGSGVPAAMPPQPNGPESASTRGAAIDFVSLGPTRMTSGGVPTSGKVNAVAVDPSRPKIIYTASGRGTGLETYSSAGIYRTIDGGAHWRAVDEGLTDPSGVISSVVNALWLDPAHPSVLLAATEYGGIFRSTDQGTSWRNVFRTTQATQFAAFSGALYASTAAGILSSSDDGTSWQVALPATTTRYPRAFGSAMGTAGNALFAGMSDGTMYALVGGTWSETGRLPYDPHTGTQGSQRDVHQIAVDPMRPATVYASLNDGRWDQDLFASTDGGRNWVKVIPYFRNQTYYDLGLGTQAIAFSQVHPHQLYVGQDGLFYFIAGDGSQHAPLLGITNLSVVDIRNVWVTPNGKDDRCWLASDQGLDDVPACSAFSNVPADDVVTKTVATGLARRFAISPNRRTLVVSLQDFDSHTSFDGGASWTEDGSRAFFLYEDGFNELQPGNPQVCYAFDEASGFQVSADGCHTYVSPSRLARSLLPSRLMTTPIAFDPSNPRHLYLASGAIVGAGFPSTPHAVFSTRDNGITLQKLTWPVVDPGMIVVDGHNSQHILVGDLRGLKSSSIEVTSDGGKTWARAAGVPATTFWYSATISPRNGRLVLASSVDAANNVFVLRSTDGGLHFTRIATVTNAPLLRGPVDRDLRRLLPQAPPAFVYSPAREIRFNQDVTKGTPEVALTTLAGAYVSRDLGASWQRLDSGLVAHSFWGIRWNAGYLYLGSDGQGVLKSSRPLQ